jgi:hypothetical protein
MDPRLLITVINMCLLWLSIICCYNVEDLQTLLANTAVAIFRVNVAGGGGGGGFGSTYTVGQVNWVGKVI